MNAHIQLTQRLSEQEFFTIQLSLDKQLYVICEDGKRMENRRVYADPDMVDDCLEVCRWFLAFYPAQAGQVWHILTDLLWLAHTCTKNAVFHRILQKLEYPKGNEATA